jgi:hypothetical protein
MRIVMSNTYCVVFLLWFSSSCVPYVASFSRLSILIVPSVFSNVYLILCWTCYHLLSSCICMRYSPLDVKQSTLDHIGQTRSIKGEIFSKKGQSLSFLIINILFISVSIQAFHVNRCLVLDFYVWFCIIFTTGNGHTNHDLWFDIHYLMEKDVFVTINFLTSVF